MATVELSAILDLNKIQTTSAQNSCLFLDMIIHQYSHETAIKKSDKIDLIDVICHHQHYPGIRRHTITFPFRSYLALHGTVNSNTVMSLRPLNYRLLPIFF